MVKRKEVLWSFESETITVPVSQILPVRALTERSKASAKYAKIAASIKEIGLVELPVVSRLKDQLDLYLLLDGHIRIEVLKESGAAEVECLVSTDDESYTYNKHVNRVATIQEHRMIINAVNRGVSEERLARALNVDISSIRAKRNLLKGICAEATDVLKDQAVPVHTFRYLRRMRPLRQVEAAELMRAAGNFSKPYAASLLAATPREQLVGPEKVSDAGGLPRDRVRMMQTEAANLDRDFKIAEKSYGADQLDLVLAKGYLAKLLRNERITRYLQRHYPELYSEFFRLAS